MHTSNSSSNRLRGSHRRRSTIENGAAGRGRAIMGGGTTLIDLMKLKRGDSATGARYNRLPFEQD